MNYKQDYLFWSLIQQLVEEQQYRIIKISEYQNEVWLECFERKNSQVIRLIRHNLDWSNWLQRDMEDTFNNVEFIRKRIRKKNIDALNIYVTTYPPVDDWEFRTEKPLQSEKIMLKTMVIDYANFQEQLRTLSGLIHTQVNVNGNPSVDDIDVEKLKHHVLNLSIQRVKAEQKLMEHSKPRLTYFFIAAQVIMFLILEVMGGSTNSLTLLKMGAKYNPLIIQGEWWRFITPIFLHIGFLHLLMNTLALYYLGVAVEKIYGNSRFLFIYLFSGFMGSVASFMFSSSLSAGASGAIFGCFGALLYFGVMNPSLFARTMGNSIITMIGINLVFGFVVPGIDNAGHIGGLVGGFLASGIVHLPEQRLKLKQLLYLIGAFAISAGLILTGFQNQKHGDPSVSISLAQQYIENEQYEKAIIALDNIDTTGEKGAQINFLLSYAQIHLGKTEEAQKHLETTIKQNPQFHQAYYNLALLYLEKHEFDKAKLTIEKAVELDPENNQYLDLLNGIKKAMAN